MSLPNSAGEPDNAVDVAPNFYPAAIGVLVVGNALLGGGGGDPRSGAVDGAQRSGSPCGGVEPDLPRSPQLARVRSGAELLRTLC